LLVEYANASADNLTMQFIDEAATTILAPEQISQYLILGDSYTLQAGYVTAKGLSFDVRYENTKPEFQNYSTSLLSDTNSYTIGATKYFKNNNIKLQTSFTRINYNGGANSSIGEVVFQIGF
jgi:hypothetical protein